MAHFPLPARFPCNPAVRQAPAPCRLLLFGRQADEQHPENSGVYFEFDDQINGAVGCVAAVAVADHHVTFELRDGQIIVVRRGMPKPEWLAFLEGIRETFGDSTVRSG